jgi:hypothetical protein
MSQSKPKSESSGNWRRTPRELAPVLDHVVVDTNVLAVAEGLNEDASAECRAACVRLLGQIANGELIVVVDSAMTGEMVFEEYLGRLSQSRLDGLGKKLAVNLYHRRFDENVCQIVEVAPCDDDDRTDFADVPSALRNFDRDDHKWIAVALGSPQHTPVFQALDGEWWQRREDLLANGIEVQFLCASDLIERFKEP